MATLGTLLYTRFKGALKGEDQFGNKYYTEKNPPEGRRAKRWVVFKGKTEASKVPAEWHAWLHYTTDEPIEQPRRDWQQPHTPNLTGTPYAYRPPGSDYRGGHRDHATGDYEAWTPN
jgi:NADH:ubiquinone oxidoreductase subunit